MAGNLFLVHLPFPLDSEFPETFQAQRHAQGGLEQRMMHSS